MPLSRAPAPTTSNGRRGALLAVGAAAALTAACSVVQPPVNTPLPTPVVKGSPAPPGAAAVKPSPSPSPLPSPSPSPSPSPAPR